MYTIHFLNGTLDQNVRIEVKGSWLGRMKKGETLDAYTFPSYKNGKSIVCFEISGSSLPPAGSTAIKVKSISYADLDEKHMVTIPKTI